MKKNIVTALIVTIALMSMTSCDPRKGCTDPSSLNYDSDAEVDNGTCSYSTAIFYMSVLNPSRPVTVSVNGSTVGTITAQYPSGPGNCSAPGCAIYKFNSSKKLDWVATEPGGLIWTGTVEPNSFQDCMKVRIY